MSIAPRKLKQIRPEARPLCWDTMDAGQQNAFRRVVEMIAEAIEALPKDDPKTHKIKSLRDPADWISYDRSTKTVFLSGGRGSGKSSILFSLIEATLTDSRVEIPSDHGDPTSPVELLRRHIVWLEPIDMEPIPRNTNLLAAILARIDEACQRVAFRGGQHESDSEYGGLLDLARDHRGAMKELKRLQNRVALAWDGNLEERMGNLDPNLYAVEVSRVEQNRLSINRAMRNVLNDLAQEVFKGTELENPLFVLPIDDFDLNPASCLELLRLLRMISVPRLFNVVLGDMSVVDVVMNLKFSSDFSEVAKELRNESASSIRMSDVANVAGEVAFNAMRKLLPPAQRLLLGNFKLEKALQFKPLGDSSADTLYRLMQGLTGNPLSHVTPSPRVLDQEVNNLLKFLLIPGPTVFRLDNTDYRNHWAALKIAQAEDLHGCCTRACYSGVSAFETSPRRLADIWYTLKQCKDFDEAIESIGTMCLDALLEEPAFSPLARGDIENALRRKPYGNWDWTTLPVKLRSVVDHGETFIPDHEPARSEAEFRLRRPTDWRFETTPWEHQTDSTFGRPLSRTSAGLLVLFHDLLVLGPHGSGFVTRFLGNREFDWPWAATRWSTATLQWPAATCSSFWGLDLFRYAWRNALDQRSTVDATRLEDLVFAWISAGSMLINMSMPTPRPSLHPTDNKLEQNWSLLVECLEKIVPIVIERSARHREAAIWLANIAILLMPEYALPKSITERFQASSILREFWRKNHTSRIIRRARAQCLGRITNAGLPDVAEELRTSTPKILGHLLTPTSEFVRDSAEAERRSSDVSTVLNVADSPPRGKGHEPSRSKLLEVWKKHDGRKKPAYQELGITAYRFDKLLEQFHLTKADLS